ncbi:hypothetical protein J6590_021762 [Homalodisca vitripennis]|nr:hypothetical protein J6590_021762 [Homalodisca vitripennis]
MSTKLTSCIPNFVENVLALGHRLCQISLDEICGCTAVDVSLLCIGNGASQARIRHVCFDVRHRWSHVVADRILLPR